jgi:hypothetical protein
MPYAFKHKEYVITWCLCDFTIHCDGMQHPSWERANDPPFPKKLYRKTHVIQHVRVNRFAKINNIGDYT